MRIAVIPAILLLVACSTAPQAAPPDAVTLTPVLVVSGPRVADLEVRIFSPRAQGQAALAIAAPGATIKPQAQVAFALEPPLPPSPVKGPPYPLPPVIIKVFRLEAAAPGPHTIEVSLHWSGGEITQEVRWDDATKGQQP